ncbi:hypothetical protein ACI2KS_12360 [Pseudomonas sp. NPDC087358]|uniref:hypothetical protein n=1 Tax=Pseudomonas sp. NPDC087358 TaxID=3364439 RepID=UPI003851305C
MNSQDIKNRELELWNILLNHEGRRELAIDQWSGELVGHAMALARLGVIDAQELQDMLEYADAAYSHVIEEKHTREWECQTGRLQPCAG